MQSAFGIEHGEISKAKMPRLPRRTGPTAAQKRTAGRGGPSGPQKVKGALNRITEAPISIKGVGDAAGRGLGATGRFFEKRPGLTGTALVGGGGAAGYRALSNKEPKKRRS